MKNNKVIYINGKFLSQTITGVQRFALENLRVMSQSGYDFVVLVPSNAVIPDWLSLDKVTVVSGFKGILWEQLSLPIFLYTRTDVGILLNLCNTAPLIHKKNVVTVHDVAFIRNPSWFSKSFAMFYKFLIPRVIKKSLHVFTVSEFVKKELIEIYNIDNHNISVVYNASSQKFRDINDSPRDSFCLAVGSIEPRKNLKFVLKYFSQRQHVKLVIVGKKSKIFNAADLDESLFGNVVFTGYVSDDDLVELYNKAKLFIFPSLYEGFGIPLIEAQSCGCPVISSNSSVMPEVLEKSAIYFDPHNFEDFSFKMDQLLSNTEELALLSVNGKKNVERFSWDISGRKIFDIIGKLVS